VVGFCCFFVRYQSHFGIELVVVVADVGGGEGSGAGAGGGIAVEVLPAADRAGAGPDLTIAVPTGLGQARNNVLVNAADALIAVGGSWGTLSEIALAMRAGRIPVVQVGGWRVLDEEGHPAGGIVHATDPAAAVAATGLWA
ncbi:hypothetical protein, partial [Actinomadura sp. BRA 177]|uniref:SLOG cluster 4 domain-containing protein n=1 Tax=Actinomadura sp. BRA 177 TaxID=2745202 RepID=UPI0015954CD0